MPIFLNNCKNRPHAKYYGADAFYDLDRTGSHAKKAVNLAAGGKEHEDWIGHYRLGGVGRLDLGGADEEAGLALVVAHVEPRR